MRPGKAVAIAVPLCLLAAAAWTSWPAPRPAAPSPRAAASSACTRLAVPFAGVAVPPPQVSSLAAFIGASGIRPRVLEYYITFGDKLNIAKAAAADSAGAVPLVQWNPQHASLLAIASGTYDSYLRVFAASARAFRCPLMLSFAHEFNGSWWPWGTRHADAAAYVAAWKHIHAVFAVVGAKNVIWVWNPNVISDSEISNPEPWWPGASEVSMVALDGYYWGPREIFTSVFAETIYAVRRFTAKPLFLAETGAYPGKLMASQITGLFEGAAQAGLAGIVYFDIRGDHDWRLQDNPAAFAAFRTAVKEWQR